MFQAYPRFTISVLLYHQYTPLGPFPKLVEQCSKQACLMIIEVFTYPTFQIWESLLTRQYNDRGKLNSSLFLHKSDFTDDDISTTNPTASLVSLVLSTNLGLKSSQTRSDQIPYPISPWYPHYITISISPWSFHIYPYPISPSSNGRHDRPVYLRCGPRRGSRPHGLL